jgi:hypothetical protein
VLPKKKVKQFMSFGLRIDNWNKLEFPSEIPPVVYKKDIL